MKLATLRRRGTELPGVHGIARLDRRTTRLATRLNAGDIAIIDHVDLDRSTAEALVAAKPAAIVNAAPSISGRYPNLGPQLIVSHGIVLLDNVGTEIFAVAKEGTKIRVDGDEVFAGENLLVAGTRQDIETVEALMREAKAGLASQLEAFAVNTATFMSAERSLMLDGVGIPEIKTKLAGRHVLVVVRSHDYAKDLKALKRYIREYHAVLIGVDGGADALLEAGLKPHLIVGDMDAVSDRALACGAELVVRVSPDGRGFGAARLAQLNLSAVSFPAALAVEDLALLLADARGATTIVTVGTHASLPEFLDRGRSGMASSLLTRLRVGPKLVDAVTVARLHRPTIPARALAATVFSALAAMGGAMWFASAGQSSVDDVAVWWDHAMAALRGLW